jgi:hypothetical protein
MKSQQERDDKYSAKRVIRNLDLFEYRNIPMGICLKIPRPLIERIMDGQRDWMDACAAIAYVCEPQMRRLRPMRLGQSEALALAPPFPPTLHVLIITKAGQDIFYVNDQPFMPY